MRAIRLMTMALLHVAVGFVIAVAVAIACAVWSRPPTEYLTGWKLERYPTEWVPIAPSFRNLPPVDRVEERFARLESQLPESSRTEAYSVTPPLSVFCSLRVLRSPGFETEAFGLTWGTECLVSGAEIEIMNVGWPKPCFSARRMTEQGFVIFEPWQDAISAPAWLKPTVSPYPLHPARVIPTRPLMWGLAANTIVYASALLMVTTICGPVVRSFRRRRNHCPACNYDRRGLATGATCPECGTISPKAPVSDA